MSNEQKPGDPADKGLDQFVSHRSGYGDDRLARLVDYLRRNPRATLASGEGALLLAEIDRLRDDLREQADLLDLSSNWADWAKGEMERMREAAKDSADHYADARDEIDRLRDQLYLADQSARSSSAEAARLGRILAALREPSKGVVDAMMNWLVWTDGPYQRNAVRAAVLAAEQEVGRE